MTIPPKKLVALGATSNDDLRELVAICNESVPADRFELIAFLDDDPSLHGKCVSGVPVEGPLALAASLKDVWFVNAIGTPSTVVRRREILAKTGVSPERFATLVHPRAIVSPSATIATGCLVFAGAVVGSGVSLGSFVDVMSNAVVSHGTRIGNYTFIASGAAIGGQVEIGEACFLGLNCSVKEALKIGKRCLLGQGTVILQDVPENSVMVGNPARFLRASLK